MQVKTAQMIIGYLLEHIVLNIPVCNIPDSKVHGANMGPTLGQQDPGGPHVGHVNLAIWDLYSTEQVIIIFCTFGFPNHIYCFGVI